MLFKAESLKERFFSSLILYVKSRLVLVRMNEVVFLLFSFLLFLFLKFESEKKEKKLCLMCLILENEKERTRE